MKPEEDAFGQSLWAYYNGKESFEIIERYDGYFDFQDTKAYFTTYEEWAPHERDALGFVKEESWMLVVELAGIPCTFKRKGLMSLESIFHLSQ